MHFKRLLIVSYRFLKSASGLLLNSRMSGNAKTLVSKGISLEAFLALAYCSILPYKWKSKEIRFGQPGSEGSILGKEESKIRTSERLRLETWTKVFYCQVKR